MPGFFVVTSYSCYQDELSGADFFRDSRGTAEKKDDGVISRLANRQQLLARCCRTISLRTLRCGRDKGRDRQYAHPRLFAGKALQQFRVGQGSIRLQENRRRRKDEYPETKLIDALLDEPWDYISLQQASGKSGEYDTYNPYLKSLISYLRKYAPKKDFKLVWHQTWAYASDSDHKQFPKYGSNQMQMYEAIMAATRNALKDNKFDVLVPSGTAIQNARTSYIGDKMNRDGYHLEVNYGRYTAACTWFEAISRKEGRR